MAVSVTASRAEITPTEEQDGEVLTCSAHSPPFQHIMTSVTLEVLCEYNVFCVVGLLKGLPVEREEGGPL